MTQSEGERKKKDGKREQKFNDLWDNINNLLTGDILVCLLLPKCYLPETFQY